MKVSMPTAIAVLFCLICPFALSAQIKFEHDINAQPANTRITNCVDIGGILYFASSDGYFGEELWQFDPATEQTKRLTDIRKLGGDAVPRRMTGYDNKVYFRAKTDEHHVQLFSYDPATGVVKQATPFYFDNFDILSLVVFQEKLWFSAQWQGRVNLWSYSAATDIFEEIPTPSFGHPTDFIPNYMAAHNGFLYGMCQDTAFRDLFFRFDPSTNTFTHEPTQYDDNGFSANRLVSCEGQLLMHLSEGTFTKRRWHLYDAVADSCILQHTDDTNIDRAVACHAGKFWFASGQKAYVFDPSTNQTALMGTVTSNAPNSVSDFRESNGQLYCTGYLGNNQNAIFKLDDATQNWVYQPYFNTFSTQLKTDVSTLVAHQDDLFAVGHPSNYDFEIYKYSPLTNSAQRMTQINQATQDGTPFAQFIEFDGRMLFNATDSSVYRIWQKDLVSGQYGVFPIQPAGGGWRVYMTASATVGDRLYFSGARKDGIYQQLWSYAPGEDTLRLHGNTGDLTQLYPWVPDIIGMVAHDSVLYWVSANEEGNWDSLRLFQFDTRTDAFSRLAGAEHLHNARDLTLLQNKLYFWTQTFANGQFTDHLWVHDLAGQLHEIPLDSLSSPSNFFVFDEKLVFNCKKNPAPFFYTDAIGVYDPNTGMLSTPQPPGDLQVEMTQKAIFQDQIWFYDEDYPDTLFYLDPSTGQCGVALDLAPLGVTASGAMIAFEGKLYFDGYTPATGNELWEYDPVTGIARLLADLNPGGGMANPGRFKVIGERLYFVANDGWRGQEIWSLSTCFELSLNAIPDTVGLQSGQITAQVQGGTPPFTYTWSNGATSPTIGGLASGFYEVTVQDATGCEAVQFTVLYGVVDVTDVLGKTVLKLYPNPAQNRLYIEQVGNWPSGAQRAQLVSLTGQVVREISLDSPLTPVDLSGLPSGVWLLRLDNGTVGKFVKW